MSGRSECQDARELRPRAFTLELTKGCNLRCAYCYYAQREDAYDPATRMSPEVARRSVDVLVDEAAPGEVLHLHFFGGEPLLNFPVLRDTVLYAEARAAEAGREFTFEVTTNGTRLGDDVVAFLNEHSIHVGVSLDGPPEIQDRTRPAANGSSYELALAGIRRLLDSRRGTELEAKSHCSVVVTRHALDLVAIAEHVQGLGFPKILLTPATDLVGTTNGISDSELPRLLHEIDRLADVYERAVLAGRHVAERWFPTLMERLLSGERRMHFCSGGRDYLGVAADGEVSLCYRFYEDEAFSMGSVQAGIDRDVSVRLAEVPLEERTACGRCWARYFCGGGCHHQNVTMGGALDAPDPVTCDVFRHSMGRTLEAWARLSRAGRLGRRTSPDPLPQDPSLEHAARAHRNGGPDPDMATEPRPSFALDDRPKGPAECHVRELDGERVVYDPATHEIVVLNETAGLIFDLCDGEHRVADILLELEARFDAPADVLRRDLESTLGELRAKGLVTLE